MAAEFRATHRYARIAPRKAMPIMKMIRGLSAGSALDTLANDNHRASAMIHKVLASAVANALQNPDVRPNRLQVDRAYVQEGPLLFGRVRYRPASMGRATPIRKRTCHLHVHLVDPGIDAGVDSDAVVDSGKADAAEAVSAEPVTADAGTTEETTTSEQS